MDLWVVAAIAGAGYAAKYLHNFSREKEGYPGLTSSSSVSRKPDLIPNFEENAAFLQNSAYRRSDQQKLSSYGENVSLLDGRFGESTASTSGFEGEITDSYSKGPEASARAMGTLRGHRRGKNLLSRHNHMQYLKPLNSLESCLMAQIYKKNSEMEDCVLTQLPSSPCVPALRPFVVTDGSRVISRSSFDSCSVQVRDGMKKAHPKALPETNEMMLGGIPYLPGTGSGECFIENNLKKGMDQAKRLSSIREVPSEMQISSQGLPNGAALFFLGVCIGVTYSTLANRNEVTKLKDVLKQTENLVQDLEEELQMKDSLTVNELATVCEDDVFVYEHESSIDNKKPTVAHLKSDSEVLINCGVETSDTHKAPEKLESMNQIEAELEAELERLELNMKGCTLQAKFSDNDELDADIVAELIQGEFRTDILSMKPSSDPSHGSGSSSSSTTRCSPNQAVSPRDLSLRLHQVIQSRLEQRIMELETALENSQKRIKHLESEQGLLHKYMSPSSSTSSFSRGSPITIEAERQLPLVMNLSGEALDAYNEAFEELNKINGSEYQKHNSTMCKEKQEEQLFPGSMFELGPTLVDGESYASNCRTVELREMFSFSEDMDEDDDDDDDDTTLLIKQIVEKTRHGSSAILHAHRAMVSLDNNEK